MGLLLLLVLWMTHQRSTRPTFSHRGLLLWGWLAAACVGPLVFDILRHTTTTDVPRYVLPGLPAAMLLTALGLSQFPPKVHLAALSVLLLAWVPGSWAVVASSPPRPWEPYRQVAARLDAWARPGDLVLVQAIPSGMIGVARYLRRDIPLVSWVSQLGARRVPADLEPLLTGRRRVALVKIHDLGASAAPEEWLGTHARLLRRDEFRRSQAKVLYFEPSDEATFLAGRSQWE
jgi:hypothetical protein